MEYLYIGISATVVLFLCIVLGVSIISYRKTNTNMNMIVRLIHHSANEIGSVGRSVDAVVEQNNSALDQQVRNANHQRVLLASLNRQLLTLETMIQRRENRKTRSSQLSNTAVYQEVPENVAQIRNYSEEETFGQGTNTLDTHQQNNVFEQQQMAQHHARETRSRPQPLEALVSRGSVKEQAPATRIPLEQRLRLKKHLETQQTQAAAQAKAPPLPQTNAAPASPVVRTRETIDVLKMKQRRVANG